MNEPCDGHEHSKHFHRWWLLCSCRAAANVTRPECLGIERNVNSTSDPYVPPRETEEAVRNNPPQDHIVLTRRRWAVYFIPVIALVSIVAIPIAILTQKYRLMFSPVGFIVLWIMMRQMTPPKGMKTKTIRGTPGMLPLLSWLGLCAAFGVALLFLDSIITGQSFAAPLAPYHYVATVVFLGIMFGGVGLLSHRYQMGNDGDDTVR